MFTKHRGQPSLKIEFSILSTSSHFESSMVYLSICIYAKHPIIYAKHPVIYAKHPVIWA